MTEMEFHPNTLYRAISKPTVVVQYDTPARPKPLCGSVHSIEKSGNVFCNKNELIAVRNEGNWPVHDLRFLSMKNTGKFFAGRPIFTCTNGNIYVFGTDGVYRDSKTPKSVLIQYT